MTGQLRRLSHSLALIAGGVQMALYGATSEVQEVIETSGIGAVLPLAQSEVESLAIMSSWRM